MTRDEAVEKFKNEVCLSPECDTALAGEDWFSMSVGYFLALGFALEESIITASYVRYKFNYWV